MIKKYDVVIIGGAGHIGLPLGIAFAGAGKQTVLYDLNIKTLETIADGKMPFLESGAESVLKTVIHKTLHVSDQKKVVAQSKFVVVVIGTPVDEHLNPQFTLFKNFFDSLLEVLDDSQHIILRSTVFPGATQKVKEYLESKGKKCAISFCPERLAQGKAMEELYTLPQIVASSSDKAFQEVQNLFLTLTKKVIRLNFLEAELAKLYTNSWRYIQFATANQFYQIAQDHGVDFYNIYGAMTTDYPRTKGFPGAGFAAGPCLFKDTMQLAAYANNNFFLGHAAMLINEGMPNFIVSELKKEFILKEKTVGILGMAFKPNNDDKRESLSYKLKKILEIEAEKVLCSDVYINDDDFVSPKKLIANSDIIIVATPHKEYKMLTMPVGKKIIDMWNFYKKEEHEASACYRSSRVHSRVSS